MTEQQSKRIKPPKPGIYRAVPFNEYMSWDAVNSSCLTQLAETSAAHAVCVVDDESIAKARGTFLHAAMLEPDRFAAQYAIGPDVKLNVKEGKDKWAEFEKANPGKTLIRGADGESVLGMRKMLWEHPLTSQLFNAPGERELSILWVDEITGLRCKARIDKLCDIDEPLILDLKKTSVGNGSTAEFSKKIYEYGYHRQAKFYMNGALAVGLAVDRFVWVTAEEDPPYMPNVHNFPEILQDHAESHIRALLDLYATCMIGMNGKSFWPGYGWDWSTKQYVIHDIAMPAYEASKPPFQL